MGTVTVACKHPSGLYLDLEDNSGELRRVTIRGTARKWGEPDHTVGGYALTEVDEAHAKAWFEKFSESSLVKDRIVLLSPKIEEAKARAKSNASVKPIAPPIDVSKEKDIQKATPYWPPSLSAMRFGLLDIQSLLGP